MKRLIVALLIAAFVAMTMLLPTAIAQQTQPMLEQTVMMETTQPLPKSGGPLLGSASVLLPAAALLLGSGVLAFAVLRRR